MGRWLTCVNQPYWSVECASNSDNNHQAGGKAVKAMEYNSVEQKARIAVTVGDPFKALLGIGKKARATNDK